MYKVHLEREIAISHRLHHHTGKCNNLHGHNLLVEVDVYSKELLRNGSSQGMVVDFGDIKKLIDCYDHKHLNSCFPDGSPLSEQPTAERLAEVVAFDTYNLNDVINKVIVKVHEAKGQYAEYTLGY